jgi:hypothetical protein
VKQPARAPRSFDQNARRDQLTDPAASFNSYYPNYVEKYDLKYQKRAMPRLFGEFLSVEHPDYTGLEQDFCVLESLPADLSKLRSPKPKHQTLIIEFFTPEEQALKDLAPRLLKLRDTITTLREKDGEGEPLFRAIRIFGLEILRESEWERQRPWKQLDIPDSVTRAKNEEVKLLSEVRALVWKQLDQWYVDARGAATQRERLEAQKNWIRVGKIMGGNLRGIREGEILNPWLVSYAYHSRLFRLLRALHLLAVWPWDRDPRTRISQISEACGIPEGDLSEFLRIDAKGQRRDHAGRAAGQSLSPEYASKIHAARQFGLNERSVANILSGLWL